MNCQKHMQINDREEKKLKNLKGNERYDNREFIRFLH